MYGRGAFSLHTLLVAAMLVVLIRTKKDNQKYFLEYHHHGRDAWQDVQTKDIQILN